MLIRDVCVVEGRINDQIAQATQSSSVLERNGGDGPMHLSDMVGIASPFDHRSAGFATNQPWVLSGRGDRRSSGVGGPWPSSQMVIGNAHVPSKRSDYHTRK